MIYCIIPHILYEYEYERQSSGQLKILTSYLVVSSNIDAREVQQLRAWHWSLQLQIVKSKRV